MGSGAYVSQNGDIGLGKIEPHHFRTSFTRINHIIKNQFQQNKIARDYISTHTNTRASALYTIPVRTHGRTDERTDVIIMAGTYFSMVLTNLKMVAMF